MKFIYFNSSENFIYFNSLGNWYYKILILTTGYLGDTTTAADALSIWWVVFLHFVLHEFRKKNTNAIAIRVPENFSFPVSRVRVSNELGAGNGSAAKFASKVSVVHSMIMGVLFCALILILDDKIAYIFTSAADVVSQVEELSYLLGISIILSSVQPILSGVAVGCGWQDYVAYINLLCYDIVGLPLGILIGKGIWGGMIFGGTGLQTIILAIITTGTDWDNGAKKAKERVDRFSQANPNDASESEREEVA
ncbi:hypothetical protein SAY87_011394 [Trapa incisa]|uniref:Uncharacterized protein n=1 Tax=Trapa incisa TaxID=236973 RepID=A0AAN7GRV3_9MYRT|nr:hypothetical protein SAY87_011394 [Trapa incisa]